MPTESGITLKLPPEHALKRMGSGDPLPYYYWPVVGSLYCNRLNAGLAYLPKKMDSILEIGYGSGLLMPTLADCAKKIVGIDLNANSQEVGAILERLGVKAELIQGDARSLPFPDASFDAVVAFSFMEHVKPVDKFIQEMRRVVKPGGVIIVGMPMVNKGFNFLFHFLNYHNIEDQHITSPGEVRRALQAMNISFQESGIPAWGLSALRIYNVFVFSK